MYLVVVYDVKSENSNKILKILRKFLFHVQNSVFEGELTDLEFKKLKQEVKNNINEKVDSVIYYNIISQKVIKKEGINTKKFSNLLI